MPQIDKYTAGTVTLTNGSTTVTGNATNWISGGLYSIVAGHVFRYGTFTSLIVSVNSANSITLATPYPGTTASGLSYEIYRYTRLETPEAVGFLQSLLARGSAANPFTRVDLDSGSVRASFRDDGTGQLGWYVGTTGAADGSQVKAATLNKATGVLSLAAGLVAPSYDASGSAGTNRPVVRMLSGALDRWALEVRGSESGSNAGADLELQRYADGGAYIATALSVKRANGNIGIGTAAPTSRLEIKSANFALTLNRDNATSIKNPLIWQRQGVSKWELGPDAGDNGSANFYLYDNANSVTRLVVDNSGSVAPGADNTQTLGASGARWSTVYAATGTINTSDGREKTPIRPLNAAEIRAAQRLAMEIGVYQWLEAVAEKGDAARQHVGMTVQRAIEIMEEEGLDPWAYGFMCRDEITRKVKVMQKRMVAKVAEVEVSYTEIEVRDGVPVQVTKTRTDKQPVMQMVAVLDEAGKPVLREIAPVEGEAEAETPKKGKRAKPQMEPVMHPVPVMIEEEVEVEIDEPAGDRLGFRPDQIDRFIMRGLAEKIALLEGK